MYTVPTVIIVYLNNEPDPANNQIVLMKIMFCIFSIFKGGSEGIYDFWNTFKGCLE